MPKGQPILERFFDKVEITESCWLWTAGTLKGGYGQFKIGETCNQSHRLSYEWFVGPIPDGLVIDHLCRTHNCVNPDHLEPVTPRENVLRSAPVLSGCCKRGHPFEGKNLVRYRGQRVCRACNALRQREYQARRRSNVITDVEPEERV